ncbi:hypothetical protein [Montanilutibacter psychrotolerans]|uniref:Uncharacterized protein n=1 Tax=Montanilutibacter psychrotolerans TaxID=1327343 RepID=A0A3M8SL17_9GAMM|nr:hypothetical protein [Lysobacter psychrotolerans]RNF81899.1 hypothetical protein EER27_15795 [Lysobacter psychrotolerans]
MLRSSLVVFAALATANALSQVAPAPAPAAATALPGSSPAPTAVGTTGDVGAVTSCAPASCRLADGQRVELEIGETLNSALHKRGERFPLILATALRVDGHEVVPAGTRGVGEIVHAARSRGGGAAGELLIAARYLELDGQQLPLRGLSYGQSGQSRTNGAAAAAIVAGPFALFIRGREIEIPVGTRVQAKLAGDVHLPPRNPTGIDRATNAPPAALPIDGSGIAP